MARIFSCGFELNSAAAGTEFGLITGSPTVQSTTARSGTYALQITSLSSATAQGAGVNFLSAVGDGPYYIRFYFRYATLPSADNCIFIMNNGTGIAVPEVRMELTSTGELILSDEDGDIGTSATLSANTWYRLEIEYDRTPAAGSEVVKLYIDGTVSVSGTNRSLSVATRAFYMGANLLAEAQTTGNWYFDDVAVNDSTGSFQNSLPGEGELIVLRPNAAGSDAGWGIGGSSPAATNWEGVDEVTPDDGVTLNADNVLDEGDFHNISATPAALASDDVINCLQVGVRFAGGSSSANAGFSLAIGLTGSAGDLDLGTEITPVASSPFRTNTTDTSIKNYTLTSYDLPGASTTAWTKSDLDTVQVGYAVTTGNTNNAIVSAIWMYVDHKPATGGPSASLSPSTSPSISPSVSPSASLSPSISPSVSPSASLSPSISPSVSPSLSPSVSPSVSPSASLSPSISPSVSPSLSPSVSPSVSPSASLSPSVSPSISPSLSPSVSPSVSPSASLSPSVSPSISPSLSPSISPSVSPSASLSPSISPSLSPSISPSVSPSLSPSMSPSVSPSASLSPSVSPSLSPSLSPSVSPSVSPSASLSPSASPSISPSVSPSAAPGAIESRITLMGVS